MARLFKKAGLLLITVLMLFSSGCTGQIMFRDMFILPKTLPESIKVKIVDTHKGEFEITDENDISRIMECLYKRAYIETETPETGNGKLMLLRYEDGTAFGIPTGIVTGAHGKYYAPAAEDELDSLLVEIGLGLGELEEN